MLAQSTLQLILGISLMWTFMPRKEVTLGFFRIQMLLVLGLSVVVCVTSDQLSPQNAEQISILSPSISFILAISIGVIAYIGSVFWTLGSRKLGDLSIYLVTIISLLLLSLSTHSVEELKIWGGQISLLSSITSSAVVGAAMTGMLLGHWYLTAPTMSTKPLHQLNLYLGIACLLHFMVSVSGFFQLDFSTLDSTQWTWLSLKWISGIIGPLVCVFMVWQILKLKNTQSATGVLFVAVILTLIGELSGLLLYEELGFAV